MLIQVRIGRFSGIRFAGFGSKHPNQRAQHKHAEHYPGEPEAKQANRNIDQEFDDRQAGIPQIGAPVADLLHLNIHIVALSFRIGGVKNILLIPIIFNSAMAETEDLSLGGQIGSLVTTTGFRRCYLTFQILPTHQSFGDLRVHLS